MRCMVECWPILSCVYPQFEELSVLNTIGDIFLLLD